VLNRPLGVPFFDLIHYTGQRFLFFHGETPQSPLTNVPHISPCALVLRYPPPPPPVPDQRALPLRSACFSTPFLAPDLSSPPPRRSLREISFYASVLRHRRPLVLRVPRAHNPYQPPQYPRFPDRGSVQSFFFLRVRTIFLLCKGCLWFGPGTTGYSSLVCQLLIPLLG